ncbi:unnamed protein product [Prorocentrum cordatum]|uniref:C2 domain-containing protein n=1 Tax=Prorocentrum cordatum TaxID=2364126 RepID=A0ABN9X794_9DINO|nr:unnamed protein product [Polarella glacialis]
MFACCHDAAPAKVEEAAPAPAEEAPKEEAEEEQATTASDPEGPPEELPAAAPAEEPAPDERAAAQHALVVRVVQARGRGSDDEKRQPFVRVRFLDACGEEKQVKETAPITDGGANPHWNEYLQFEGIGDLALYSVCLEPRDKSDTKGEPIGGIAKIRVWGPRGRVWPPAAQGHHLGSLFPNVDFRLGVNNFGTWGNGARASNKLSLNIMGASGKEDMHTGIGGLFADKSCDLVCVCA